MLFAPVRSAPRPSAPAGPCNGRTALGRCRILVVLLGAALLAAAAGDRATAGAAPAAEAPPAPRRAGKTEGEKPAPAAVADLEGLSLPAGAVVVVCETMADALKLMPPKAFVLLPEQEFEKLRAEVRRLTKQLRLFPKGMTPSKCLLTGKVEGNVVLLQARFDFATPDPNTVVALAGGQGRLTDAALDGHTPVIKGGEADGFFVEVRTPGEHQLTLDLEVAVATRGNTSGFVLDLPRAPATRLELELPAGVKDVRVGNRPVAEVPLLTLKGQQLKGLPPSTSGPGIPDKLDLSWKGDQGAPKTPPVLTADGRVHVQLDARGLTTTARLTLTVQGGQTSEWPLLVPRGAEVKVEPPEAGAGAPPPGRVSLPGTPPPDVPQVVAVGTVDQECAALRTIRLKEPSAAPLAVTVTTHGPLPPAGAPVPVGPFVVVGAMRQSGTLTVSNAVPDLQLEFQPHGDLARREVKEEDRQRDPYLAAEFQYLNVPRVDRPQGTTGPASLSWLDVSGETVKGQVRTRVMHAVDLVPDGPGGLAWRVLTTVEAIPKRTDPDTLKVQMPPGCDFNEENVTSRPERKVRHVDYDRASRVVQLKLARAPGESSLKTFWVKLEWRYPGVPIADSGVRIADPRAAHPPSAVRHPQAVRPGQAVLALPRPVGTIDQGGGVTVHVPDDLELVVPETDPPALQMSRQAPHDQTWRSQRAPEQVEVTWRPYRPEVRVTSVVDLDLASRQGHVRQKLQYQFTQSAPAQVALLVPEAAADSLAVDKGGSLAPLPHPGVSGAGPPAAVIVGTAPPPAGGGRSHVRLVNLPDSVGTKHEHEMELSYHFTPAGTRGLRGTPGAAFAVPLVVPEQVTQGETKVRVWAEPGSLPLPAGGPWAELNVEEVPDRQELPALVLRVQRVDTPLSLLLGSRSPAFAVLAHRILVQAEVGEEGGQSYRARFLLGQLAGRHLDVELPIPAAVAGLQVSLNGKRVAWSAVNGAGQASEGGRAARLLLSPDLVRESSVLEVRYQLPPGRGGAGLLQTPLQPPVLRGHPGRVPTRWQVTVPANWVTVGPEGGPDSGRVWGRRGWLLAPRLAVTSADLERWFAGTESTAVSSPGARAAGGAGESELVVIPSLVCWQDGLGPVVLTHVPQQAWLLLCSLGLLLVGLLFYGLLQSGRGVGILPAPPGRFWAALALLALAVAVAGLLWPTALAAAAYGCEPGAAVLLLFALAQWLLHERYRRQIVFLPSFSRARGSSSLERAGSAPQPHGEPSTVDAPPPVPGSSAGKLDGSSRKEAKEDRGSKIEDRGSKIEDRGSKIENRG